MKYPNSNTNGSSKSGKKVAKDHGISPHLDAELDELLGALDDSSRSRDSFLKAHRAPDGSIHLSSDEVSTVLREIETLAEEQRESGYTLTALSYAFLGLGHGDQLACADGTALSSMAAAQAGRAEKNAERIRTLFSATDARPPKPGS